MRIPFRTTVLSAFCLFFCGLALGGDATIRIHRGPDGDTEILGRIEFYPHELSFGRTLAYDTVALEECVYTPEIGRPMLPVTAVRVAVPTDFLATGVEILNVTRQELPGCYSIFPAQQALPVSVARSASLTLPDAEAYASAGAYPAAVFELDRQFDLAGQPIVVLRAYPLEYIPAAGRLNLRVSIEFRIRGRAGYVCGDYMSPVASTRAREDMLRELRDMVVNGADVSLTESETAVPSRALEPGQYDYVIITRATFIEAFQPLADWKTRKGVPAKIVNRAWIYDSYAGGSNPEKIRNFVIDAAQNWGARYFLLGGDTGTIPPHQREILDETVPNDTYYADYDDDWTCEVSVGRAPARHTGEIAAFVNKVLRYEQDPPLTDFARTTLMLGFDLNEAGSNEGEGCKELIRGQFVPGDWSVITEYDSEPGVHRADSIAKLNAGANLINHIDHCGTTVMGVGSVTHGELLFTGDMAALSNAGRCGILYSIGCWPCDYPADTCIAEAFVRNAGGGGVAFVGNSRSGYYNPYVYNTLSLRFDIFFFRRLLMFDAFRLGDCFREHKNHAYLNDALLRYIFTELTLLGDPELPIWTADPRVMQAVHPRHVPLEAGLFEVQLTDADGPLSGADVCLWKGDEIHAVATADANGIARFALAPASAGTLYVTASKRNYVPYLGAADVGCRLDVAVDGRGTVQLIPDRATYDLEDQVILVSIPDTGWTFDHWSGDAEGTLGVTVVIVSGDMSVTAHFRRICPEDLNGDGEIDLMDLAELLGAYGQIGEHLPADLNHDGMVDLSDLAELLGAFGQSCN